MSKAAWSIRVFSIYAVLVGASLAIVPNLVLSALGMEETDELWIRLLGVVVVILAIYYDDGVRNEAAHVFVTSVLERLFFAVALVVFVATGEAWQLLGFAAIEVAGAVWTIFALRADAAT